MGSCEGLWGHVRGYGACEGLWGHVRLWGM